MNTKEWLKSNIRSKKESIRVWLEEIETNQHRIKATEEVVAQLEADLEKLNS